tara:strand:+ start:291 stop:1097 length:807 start_codon:yes stop_codon:yes gene_type:complete
MTRQSAETVDTTLLSRSQGRLLFEAKQADKHYMVREGLGLRWLHFGSRDIQTILNLDHPDQLTAPYSRAMLSALLYQQNPTSLLNLGLGGGSFERFFHSRLPDLRITSVESDSQVIQLARRYFQLPPHHPVIVDDAARYLSRCQFSFDLIFCDIHLGNQHPSCLTDSSFHAAAYRCLSPTGVYTLNVLADSFPQMVEVLKSVRDSFPEVHLLDIPKRKNLIIFALKQSPPDTGDLLQRATQISERLNLPATALIKPQTAIPQRQSLRD